MQRLFSASLFLLFFILGSWFTSCVFSNEPAEMGPNNQPEHLAFWAVPFTQVEIADSKIEAEKAAVWADRLEINRTISIPHNFDWCDQTGRFTNFAKAAGLMEGKFEGIYFNDSDVYKVLEGTAYSLGRSCGNYCDFMHQHH